MATFSEEYILYLIKQYYEKPKAKAEMELLLGSWEEITDFFKSFVENLDIDNAEGEVLDLIGRIVGLNRRVNSVIAISYFGFSSNSNSKGFSDKFDDTRPSATLYDKFGALYSAYQLDDPDYRNFLKIKIAKNTGSPFLASDDRPSLQQVVFDAFDGGAYVVDNKDQTLTLYVSPDVDSERLRLIINLDILPRPVTFSYRIIVQAEPSDSFGFSNNPNSKGFSDKFDSSRVGGYFARKLLDV